MNNMPTFDILIFLFKLIKTIRTFKMKSHHSKPLVNKNFDSIKIKMAELRGSLSYGSVLDPKERGAHPLSKCRAWTSAHFGCGK
jgi:hypothetical protein